MNKYVEKFLWLPVVLSCFCMITAYRDQSIKRSLNDEQRIDSLLSKMTIDEKIGQTGQRGVSSRVKGPLSAALKDAVRKGRVGSVINVTNVDQVNELQRIAVTESPHGIPLIFSRDVIHGFKTIFPIPLGLAATWDSSIVEAGARVAATEASASGIRWTFAPMLDIARDARWGRIAESPGEDPYLATILARAYVKGFQGSDLSSPNSIAACAKHFVGYGAAEGGRDYNTANIPEPLLRDVYLKPFKAAKEAGITTFMASFNDLNGVPASGNSFLLKTILRNEWQFKGLVVSDWNAVIEMINHGYCADAKDAAKKAANSGVDMEMASTAYETYLKELVTEGKVSLPQLDSMAKNILRVKYKLGLFDHPYTEPPSAPVALTPSNLETSKKAAIESIVLLKNDGGILPLSKSVRKIAVIGPLADAAHDQLGTWAFDGESKDTETPLTAMRKYWGEQNIFYAPGLSYSRQRTTGGFSAAFKAAEKADMIVFFAGEEAILSGEAHSRADISLPGAQEDLINLLNKTGKPVVMVLMAGRPITISNIIDKANAIIMAWHPGSMGGPAITDILSGVASPCGRLPVTWPKTSGQLPLYYNHTNTGRPATKESYVGIDDIPVGAWQSSLGNTSHYLDAGYLPQFTFGYGLSYTTFAYGNMVISKKNIKIGEGLKVSAEISNTGLRPGTEVVQLYTQQLVGDIVRPVKELKAFKRITLLPGQKEIISFDISTDDLAIYNQQLKHVTESGKFKVWISKNAADGIEGSFEIK